MLDTQLQGKDYVCGDDLTIADIAIFPWIRGYKWSKIDITLHPNVLAWKERVHSRAGVMRGLAYGVKADEVDQWSEETRNATPRVDRLWRLTPRLPVRKRVEICLVIMETRMTRCWLFDNLQKELSMIDAHETFDGTWPFAPGLSEASGFKAALSLTKVFRTPRLFYACMESRL